jgi:hypothetical protein
MAGEHLDLSIGPPEGDRPGGPARDASRSFVGVRFDCCSIYARIYINDERTAYEGRCPRCCRAVRLMIGPGGSNSRFFTAR